MERNLTKNNSGHGIPWGFHFKVHPSPVSCIWLSTGAQPWSNVSLKILMWRRCQKRNRSSTLPHLHFSSIIAVIHQNRQIHKLLLGLTKFRQICRLRYCMFVSERFKILRFIFFPLWKSNLWTKPGVFRLRVQLFCSQSTTLRIYSHERMLQMKVRRLLRIGFHSHFLRWILRGCLHGGGGPRVGEVTRITY